MLLYVVTGNSGEPLFTADSVQLEVVPGDAGEVVFRSDELQWLSLAGVPNTPVGDEPSPNGGRINMGAYGGTVEASMSSLSVDSVAK